MDRRELLPVRSEGFIGAVAEILNYLFTSNWLGHFANSARETCKKKPPPALGQRLPPQYETPLCVTHAVPSQDPPEYGVNCKSAVCGTVGSCEVLNPQRVPTNAMAGAFKPIASQRVPMSGRCLMGSRAA